MKRKTFEEEMKDLAQACQDLVESVRGEWKSILICVVIVLSFGLGMVVEHYFSDLTSILWTR